MEIAFWEMTYERKMDMNGQYMLDSIIFQMLSNYLELENQFVLLVSVCKSQKVESTISIELLFDLVYIFEVICVSNDT